MRRDSIVHLLGPVVVLAALALGVFWLSGGPSDPAGSGPEGPTGSSFDAGSDGAPAGGAATDGPPSGREVVFWLDGWSQRTSGTVDGRVAAASELGTRLASRTVRFEPATVADVEELLARDPDLVARLMARLVRFDVELSCIPSGCVSQRGPLPLEWLVSPQLVPNLGEVYAGWQVEHGVWLARAALPDDSHTVAAGFVGWEPAVLTLPYQADEETLFGGEGTDGAGMEAPAGAPQALRPGNADVVISAAFGTVFALSPNWIDPDGVWAQQPYAVQPVGTPAGDLGTLPAGAEDPALLWRGLGHRSPLLKSLSPTLLTMLSSPTFGCNGALCVPEVVEVAVEEVESTFYGAVCPHPEFPDLSGFYPPEGSGVGQVAQLTVTVMLPAPIRQLGVDLPPVDDWDGHVEGGFGAFTGDPPLVEVGMVVVPLQQVLVFSGDPLIPHALYTKRSDPDGLPLSRSSWSDPWWNLVACD